MDDNDSNYSSATQVKETKEEADGTTKCQYKKNKTATQGVSGQLYESKLNALILYRLLNDDKVTEFYLGSNLDEIGDMDDVCIKLMHKDYEKPLLILIQAKHKENASKGIHDDDLYNPKNDFYLPKNFRSFVKLKGNFNTIKNDVIYSHKLEDVIPHFIFYTPAVSETMSRQRIKEPKNSTINIVKNLISSRNGGKVFQLNMPEDVKEVDLKKVTNNYSTSDREVAEEFFNNLYFFTDQAQQDEVGTTLENEIARNQALEKSQLHLRPEAVFLNFYGKVHKWWLLQRKAEYLMKNCNFLHSNLSDLVIDAYLCLLHYNYVSHLELYSIQFNTKSIKSIQELLNKFEYEPNSIKANVFRIKTNSVLLASIKLKDCLGHAQKYGHCSYFDYSNVSKMSIFEFDILLREIKNTKIEMLVIIFNKTRQIMYERLENILNEFHMNIVLITEESQTINLGYSHDMIDVNDHIYGLIDIINEEKILNHKIVVQGEEIDLYKIIDDKPKHQLINAEMLLNILNNEIIKLGRSLSNHHKNKDWFQKRTIVLHKIEMNELFKIKEYPLLDTLYDVDKKIVIITAEPGMGKSTLLSLLSAKTKMYNPKTWIVRINLQDYSEDFNTWKNNNVDIGLRESMLLVCKAELNEVTNDAIDLQMTETGALKLINKTLQGTSLLLLKLIVQTFNEGRIIFIFDGFDKMCPHYKRGTVKFIEKLIHKRNMNTDEKQVYGNRVWITSRPYNSAKRTLQTKLAVPFSLAPLTHSQQEDFYKKYWQANISKEHLIMNYLNKQQIINNIRNFLRNVSQNIHVSSTSSIALQVMCETAREYLQEEYDFTETECNKSAFFPRDELLIEALHLSGIPLHMKIYAKHFVECFKICAQFNSDNNKVNLEKWNFKVNTFKFFEKFHESKLSEIFHEGKNPFHPDCRIRYSAAKKNSIKQHKIFAFWSIFDGDNLKKYWKLTIIEDDERVSVFKDFASLIENIKKGNVKVGLIDSIHRGVPRFVHQAFAECYAVEFIADLLKSFKLKQSIDRLAIDLLINYILDSKVGLMTVFDQKLKIDNELNETLSTSRTKSIIFEVLMKQNSKIKNSLHNVLENGFREIARILVHSIEGKINSENITHFVDFIGGYFFIYTASFDYKDLLEYVLCKIREADSSIIDYLSKIIILPINVTNKELIVERLNTVGINLNILPHSCIESSAFIDEIDNIYTKGFE